MSAIRTPLPQRRPSVTRTIDWQGRPLNVTVGFDAGGLPREVFARGPKEGTDLSHTVDDACVIISVALQSGVPAPALAKSLGRVPTWAEGREGTGPASVIAAVLAVVLEEGARA